MVANAARHSAERRVEFIMHSRLRGAAAPVPPGAVRNGEPGRGADQLQWHPSLFLTPPEGTVSGREAYRGRMEMTMRLTSLLAAAGLVLLPFVASAQPVPPAVSGPMTTSAIAHVRAEALRPNMSSAMKLQSRQPRAGTRSCGRSVASGAVRGAAAGVAMGIGTALGAGSQGPGPYIAKLTIAGAAVGGLVGLVFCRP
jgi:hypothetical protein